MSKSAAKKSKKSSAPKPVVIKPDSMKNERPTKTPKNNTKTPLKIRDFRAAKIAAICLGLFLGFALLAALVFNNANSSKLNKYKNTKEFGEYTKSLNAFLTANSGVYAKTYSCQANANDLWNPPISPISKKRETLDVQLARQLIDLKPKWEAVSKTFPAYNKFFLFKVLPLDHGVYKDYQNAADLMDRTNALVNHTEDYSYYCPGYIYPGMDDFSHLTEYSKNKPVTDSAATINQHMVQLASTGNQFKKVSANKNWAATRTAYLAFLHKTLEDLTALRNANVKNPAGTNMSAQFSADKKLLDKTLAEAAKAGQNIGPDTDQLMILYNKVSAK